MDLKDIKKTELLLLDNKVTLGNTYERNEVKRLKTAIRKLAFDLDSESMKYLETNDAEYAELVKANLALLANSNIEFRAVNEAGQLFSSHAKRFTGELSSTGYLSCKTMEYDTAYFFFQKGYYPVNYTGLVNCFGEMAFWTASKAFSLFRYKIPVKFIGSIDDKGNVFVEAREHAPIRSSSVSIDRVEADLFSGDENKRAIFLTNKAMMKEIIKKFRQSLIAEKPPKGLSVDNSKELFEF